MRSWIVAVGIAAALLAAIGVYVVTGARRGREPQPAQVAAPPPPVAPPTPLPAAPPPPPEAPAPAAAPAVADAPAPRVDRPPPARAVARRDAAREQALAERTAARELASAQRRTAAERQRADAARALAARATAAPAPAPAPGRDVDRALPAELTGAISGRLVDERGLPMGAISVLAIATDGGDGQETLSDDDGAFLVPGLRPGRYVVFAGLGSALASRLGARGVDVAAARVASVELREQPRGGTVRVSAVHPDGRPASGEAILLSGAPGSRGTYGPLLGHDLIWFPGLGSERMVLDKVPPGTYTLVLLLDGARATARAAQEAVVVAEGDVTVSVHLGDEVPRG